MSRKIAANGNGRVTAAQESPIIAQMPSVRPQGHARQGPTPSVTRGNCGHQADQCGGQQESCNLAGERRAVIIFGQKPLDDSGELAESA